MAYIGRSVEIGMFEKQVLTADSSTTTFTLSFAVGSANSLLVVYGGVIQEPAVAYSVSGGGQQIVFSEAPATGTTTYIIYLGKQLTTPRAAGQETTKQTFAGDGSTVTFTLTDPPVVPAGIMVFVDGILQREGSGNNYVSSGSTITFTSAPDSSAEIDVYTLVKEKVSIDTVADGSITVTKLAASHPTWNSAGDFTFPLTGSRIRGDFSTGTFANRVAFQTSTTNSQTSLTVLPNGTNVNSSIGLFDNSDPTNAGRLLISQSTSSSTFTSGITGTGSYVPMTFVTGGSERVRIDTSGNLLVGTTTANANFYVYNAPVSYAGFNTTAIFSSSATASTGTGGLIAFEGKYTSGGSLANFAAIAGLKENSTDSNYSGYLGFYTRSNGSLAAERMRIDSSGNLGIGTASPSYKLHVRGADATANLVVGNTTEGTQLEVLTYQDDKIVLRANDSSNTARIMAFETGTSERMRITSDGNLLVGRTSASVVGAGSRLQTPSLTIEVGGDTTGSTWNRTDTNGAWVAQRFYAQGSQVGFIQVNTSSTTFSTTSDYRLKENVAPMTGALAKVAQLKPVTYKWKVDGSDGEGFIAHELAEVVPQCVSGEKDAVYTDGSINPQGIDTSFLVATLTAAIQELKAIVDAQAVEIAALKAK
jgi:hypothetical protein